MLASSTRFEREKWPGLSPALELVDSIFRGGDLPRSVLLFGPEGSGTLDLARHLAHFALCLDPQTGGPCGECKACRGFQNGNAVDFQLIAPAGRQYMIRNSAVARGATDDDESSTVPILDFFRTRPLVARHKVVLIHDAHRMNLATSNALLKTLEEPMPHAKLILTTESPSQLAPTILSRCFLIRCSLPERLDEATPMEHIFSEGSPGRLDAIRTQPGPYQALFEVLERIEGADARAALRVAELFRAATENLPTQGDQGARFRQAESLRLLAAYWLRQHPDRPESLSQVIEAHRRTLGNVNFALETDALFTDLLQVRS